MSDNITRLVTDTERLDALEKFLINSKWADALPDLRPIDENGDYTQKYIGKGSLRPAIDAMMWREWMR